MQGIGNLIDFQAFLSKLKSLFVEKEAGKGLSSNDYTDSEKSKLSGIANNANNYSLPTASASTLGGIKIGEGLSIDNGILNASSSNGLKVIGYGTNITNGTITFNEAVSIVMGTRITTSIYGSELNGTPNTFIIFPG